MEAAEKFDPLELASAQQLDKMMDGNLEAADVHRINDKKKEIWEKVKNAMQFNDQEKNEIRSTLESGLKDNSLEAVISYGTSIERRRNRIQKMILQYFSQLHENQKYFAKREDYDAIKKYKDEFLQQDESGKQEWLDTLAQEIQERVDLHKELSQYVSEDQLSRLRRSELKRMKGYIHECDKVLDEHQKLFSPEELKSIKSQMADCVSQRDQMKLLTIIVAQLEKRKRFADIYLRLPARYQSMWGNISGMTLEQREARYEKLVVKIEEEYEHALYSHPDRKHIARKDRQEALAYVRSEKTSGGEKFRALKKLEAQIQKQKKEVSTPFEAMLAQLEKHKGPKEIKMLRDRFYDAETYAERKALADEVKVQLVEAQNEAEESRDLTKEYEERLKDDLAERIIGKGTYREAMKRWEIRSMEDKRDVLAIYDADRSKRKNLLQNFLKLPPEIQKKNSDFFELTHTDRKARFNEIKEELNAKKRTPAPKEKAGREVEKTEQTPVKKIEALAALAATATRSQNYEKAIRYYEQILEIDPEYEIAVMNIEFLEAKLEKLGKERGDSKPQAAAHVSSEDRYKIKQSVEAAANTSMIKKRRRRNTITEFIVSEAKKSETIHKSSKAKDKTKNLSGRNKRLHQQLFEHTRGSYILQGGEAQKVIWLHEKGLRIKNNESAEARIEKQVKKEIVESGDKTPYNAIQFYNDNDNVSNADIAAKELEKRDQETRNIIQGIAGKELKPTNDNEELLEKVLEEEVDKKDLSVELRAA